MSTLRNQTRTGKPLRRASRSYRTQAATELTLLHSLLRLSHHDHSGKHLGHSYTSYRALFILLAAFGVSLVVLQQQVMAENLLVTAVVPADAPTTAPTILQPSNSVTTTNTSVIVSGECPTSVAPLVISVYNNGSVAGSTPCGFDGTYSVSVHTIAGLNTLIARTTTITNGHGPDSIPVSFTYTPIIPPTPEPPATAPVVVAPATETPTTSTVVAPNAVTAISLAISAQDVFIVFGPAKPAVWRGSLSGGTAPYTLSIDWGDGTTDRYEGLSEGEHEYSHSYVVMSAYDIQVTTTDSSNLSTSQHYAAVTAFITPGITTSGNGDSTQTTTGGGITERLKSFLGMFGTPTAKDGVVQLYEIPSVLVSAYVAYSFTLLLVGLLWYHAHFLQPASLRFITNMHAKEALQTKSANIAAKKRKRKKS